MTHDDDPEEAAARLEQALERIAALARRPPEPVANPGESVVHTPDTEAVANRLDALIAQLRGALDSP